MEAQLDQATFGHGLSGVLQKIDQDLSKVLFGDFSDRVLLLKPIVDLDPVQLMRRFHKMQDRLDFVIEIQPRLLVFIDFDEP